MLNAAAKSVILLGACECRNALYQHRLFSLNASFVSTAIQEQAKESWRINGVSIWNVVYVVTVPWQLQLANN